MKYIPILVLTITIIIILLFVKYKFYTTKSNSNISKLIKGPTPPNDEYYPIIVSNETGIQDLYTNKNKLSGLNYDIRNNILYADNFQGNLKNKSALVSNLIEENASNNLLVQTSNNVTSLLSPGKTGDVLYSRGANNIPLWGGLYDNIPGFDSILYRPTVTNQSRAVTFPITNITYTTETRLNSDIYAVNLTVEGTLYTNGFRIVVTNTLTVNGLIIHDSLYGTNHTLGRGIEGSDWLTDNGKPTNFGGGIGGDGGGGNRGGQIVPPSNKEGGQKLFYQYPYFLLMGYYNTSNNLVYYQGGASGATGKNILHLSTIYNGGSSGEGGGVIHICAKNIVFGPNGQISAIGTNGSDGQTDNTRTPRGGGGGGGGGGLIVIITNTKGLSPTDKTKFNVSGGNPGRGGLNAQKGGDGKVIIFDYL